MFRIYPAVDIKKGRCVRLYKGDLERETVFSENPLEMALHWAEEGASYLHVVDLDGAAEGVPVNLEIIGEILKEVGIPVQVGGGVRHEWDIEMLLSMGASRVVLGTRALEETSFMKRAIREYGERIIISIDTRGGKLGIRGWTEDSERSAEEVVEHLIESGAKHMIHTDIEYDGTLEGCRLDALKPFMDRGIGIIAAGGVSTTRDVESLRALSDRGIEGVIIGRSLYSGGVLLPEILRLEEV
jgi:phosphoribosylformimino-5-aminoimidazole carboxamide ribotide isomerase